MYILEQCIAQPSTQSVLESNADVLALRQECLEIVAELCQQYAVENLHQFIGEGDTYEHVFENIANFTSTQMGLMWEMEDSTKVKVADNAKRGAKLAASGLAIAAPIGVGGYFAKKHYDSDDFANRREAIGKRWDGIKKSFSDVKPAYDKASALDTLQQKHDDYQDASIAAST